MTVWPLIGGDRCMEVFLKEWLSFLTAHQEVTDVWRWQLIEVPLYLHLWHWRRRANFFIRATHSKRELTQWTVYNTSSSFYYPTHHHGNRNIYLRISPTNFINLDFIWFYLIDTHWRVSTKSFCVNKLNKYWFQVLNSFFLFFLILTTRLHVYICYFFVSTGNTCILF